MTEIEFKSKMGVELIDFYGGDSRVVQSARVSTLGANEPEPGEGKGLVKFLLREGHCYDGETDVLTRRGWVNWVDVQDEDEFCTVDLDSNEVTYSRASSITRQHYSGEMVRIVKTGIDLLVTPGHRMVSSTRLSGGVGWTPYGIENASEFHNRAYRVPRALGVRAGETPTYARLLGFVLGDAHVAIKGGITFHLRKKRKIDFLKSEAAKCGFRVSVHADGETFGLISDSEFLSLARRTYTPSRERCVPDEVMDSWSSCAVDDLLEGLIESDGHRDPGSNKVSICTVSRTLANQLQQFGAIGLRAVSFTESVTKGDWSNGSPLFTMRPSTPRSDQVRVGWTPEDREREVSRVKYDGTVYCATVPNGTLFVRRGGSAVWSGNSSPFEHSGFTFRVHAPIFVTRQMLRHRSSQFNEESGRYRELEPVFYVPSAERPVVQVGKTGDYTFEDDDEANAIASEIIQSASQNAWADYRELVFHGIAKEVARMVLPVNLFSTMYMTLNARNLMHFLDLRLDKHAQSEIREVAEHMEVAFSYEMPWTYDAWKESKNG